jgi:hypothetical protein
MSQTDPPETPVPTKVCPHCAVQSTTTADTCPACGKPYVRGGRPKPVVLVAGGVVVAAVIAGAAVALSGGDDNGKPKAEATATATAKPQPTAEPYSVSIEQARSIPLDLPKAEVLARFGPPKPATAADEPAHPIKNALCTYYNFAGEPEGDIRVCYRNGKLAAVTTVYPPSERRAAPKKSPTPAQ